MKKIILSLFLSSLLFSNAYAVTLYQALNETYKKNTQLNAERENIKAAEEDKLFLASCSRHSST